MLSSANITSLAPDRGGGGGGGITAVPKNQLYEITLFLYKRQITFGKGTIITTWFQEVEVKEWLRWKHAICCESL